MTVSQMRDSLYVDPWQTIAEDNARRLAPIGISCEQAMEPECQSSQYLATTIGLAKGRIVHRRPWTIRGVARELTTEFSTETTPSSLTLIESTCKRASMSCTNRGRLYMSGSRVAVFLGTNEIN